MFWFFLVIICQQFWVAEKLQVVVLEAQQIAIEEHFTSYLRNWWRKRKGRLGMVSSHLTFWRALVMSLWPGRQRLTIVRSAAGTCGGWSHNVLGFEEGKHWLLDTSYRLGIHPRWTMLQGLPVLLMGFVVPFPKSSLQPNKSYLLLRMSTRIWMGPCQGCSETILKLVHFNLRVYHFVTLWQYCEKL